MSATTHRSTTWSKIRGQFGRAAKRWRLSRAGQPTKTAAFITGCQRSGTKMLLKTLDQSPSIWTHDHRQRDLAYAGRQDPAYQISAERSLARLVPIDRLAELIHCRQAPVVAFHSLADSQIIDQILAEIPEARAIWIYRRYGDVAQSAVHLWGQHQLDLIRRFHLRQFDRLKWRGELISPQALEQVDACYRDDLTPQEGGALLWYLRNQLLFQLSLAASPRVLLVKYEDLVTHPAKYFADVFHFLATPFRAEFVDHIFSTSVQKPSVGLQSPAVIQLCDELTERLDSAYAACQSRAKSSSVEQ